MPETTENNTNNLSSELETPCLDTVNEEFIEKNMPKDTKSEENLSFVLESSSPKEQYNRSTLSVLWNSLRSWTEIVNNDWLKTEGPLEKKYHTRFKNEIIKAVNEQIKFMDTTWSKEAIGNNSDIFNLIISNEEKSEKSEKANHELIIKLKNGLHNNKAATALLNKLLTGSEARDVKMEDSTTLEMLHKTLFQERFKLRLLLLSTFMYAQETMQTTTDILNNIVNITPQENKEKIQKNYPAFEEDTAQYLTDEVLFKDMQKNKDQIKKLLENSEKKIKKKKNKSYYLNY